jgi:archaellum component FlaC
MEDNRVVILLEDLRAQFRTFGDGLQFVQEKIDKLDQRIERIEQKLDAHIEDNRRDFETNRRDHQQIVQAVKELDTEVVTLKRVK